MTGLAYTPFLDPINAFHEWWWLLILPLSFGIAVIYKALKEPKLDHFWPPVVVMTVQIILAMAGLAVLLVFWIEVVLPRLPVT